MYLNTVNCIFFEEKATARQIYIYKAKNGKLLVLFTHAQKTKFIFK